MVLRVIVQIVPFGDEEATREIGRLDIFNKRRVTGDLCEYGVIDLSSPFPGLYSDTVYHLRANGAWTLIQLVTDMIGESP